MFSSSFSAQASGVPNSIYSRARGKLINEKNLNSKISCQTSYNLHCSVVSIVWKSTWYCMLACPLHLKGVWHEILTLGFFHESVSSWPMSFLLGHFKFVYKNSLRYLRYCQNQWCQQKQRLIIAGVVVISDKLSPVSLTPVMKACSDFHQFHGTGE